MSQTISRRDFLKLAGLLPTQILLSRFKKRPWQLFNTSGKQNVLVIVFDTWSAKHLSLFGYQRRTAPHLEALADKAIVYHNHYAAAPWTVPGTASLLTGLYPWTHRIFNTEEQIKYNPNVFGLFEQGGYHTLAYTHNRLAYLILQKFAAASQELMHPSTLFLAPDPTIFSLFERDVSAYDLTRTRGFMDDTGAHNLLFLAQPLRAALDRFIERVLAPYKDKYRNLPPAIPTSRAFFVLEDAFNWMIENIPLSPQPFLHYYHFYPPHSPYRPRIEFSELFNDDWEPPEKPFFFAGPEPRRKILRNRREYDRFIADVDEEFASFYRQFERSGILENTWLVLTSDHGELFERGHIGHGNISLFEPLVNVPLLIFPPGSSDRVDIHDRTSAVDVLPTLLHLTDLPPLPGLPGHVLPPFNTAYNGMNRQILAMNPKNSRTTFQMWEGTIAMLEGEFKMVYYFGHEEMGDVQEHLELYDLANDPEEMENLVSKLPDRAEQMWNALEKKLTQAESKYPVHK